MTYARRVDENQAEIVSALRQIGATVTPLHTVGKGVADLLVSWRQRWFVLEIKRDSKGKLTKDEKRWIADQRAPVFIVNSASQAINFMQDVP